MSYVKTTDFLAKDALASGNPLKIVKGSEIDTEFNNIATADALNLKKDGTVTVSGNIPMGGFKLTGLAQGSSSQDSVRFDQLPSGTNLLPVASGGTGSGTASGARTNLSAAASGANSDITSLSALSTALSIGQGGTGQTTASAAFDAIKQAATDSATGVVELATVAEVQTGTDTVRAVTPAGFNGSSLGWNQTWQSVTRTSGTTYYNTTGKPLFLKVEVISTATLTGSSLLTINGSNMGNIASSYGYTGQGYGCGSAIIPAGASYAMTDTNVASRTSYEMR